MPGLGIRETGNAAVALRAAPGAAVELKAVDEASGKPKVQVGVLGQVIGHLGEDDSRSGARRFRGGRGTRGLREVGGGESRRTGDLGYDEPREAVPRADGAASSAWREQTVTRRVIPEHDCAGERRVGTVQTRTHSKCHDRAREALPAEGPGGQGGRGAGGNVPAVARDIASADLLYVPGRRGGPRRRVLRVMASLDFLPNSPTLMNAGRNSSSCRPASCSPSRTRWSPSSTPSRATALIHQSGGGTGFAFSRIRPKNDGVATTGGIAEGPSPS